MPPQRALLAVGTLVAAALVGRFAIDFGRWMPVWLAVPAWALVAVTVAVLARNVLARRRETSGTLPKWQRASLFAIVPLGFVGSSLDCMGLSLDGCTTTCSVLKVVWFPVLVLACLVAARTGTRRALTVLLALSFASLVPHCVCRNPVNAWWMDLLGESPMCLGWGFVASLVAIGALARGSSARASLVVSGAITAGTIAFFVGHHYFRFPW